MTGWINAGRIRIRLPGWAYALARLLLLRNEPAAPRESASKLATPLGLRGYSETGRTDSP